MKPPNVQIIPFYTSKAIIKRGEIYSNDLDCQRAGVIIITNSLKRRSYD
jgi:hypothetical protein